tara:strand:+ start:15940 stop:16206 length:267 start_codon:yes stop_codon:yes gene_type:complete
MNIELLTPDKKMLIKAATQLCEKLNDSDHYYAEAKYSADSGCLHTWVISKEEPLLHIEGAIIDRLTHVATSTPEVDNQVIDELRVLLG